MWALTPFSQFLSPSESADNILDHTSYAVVQMFLYQKALESGIAGVEQF